VLVLVSEPSLLAPCPNLILPRSLSLSGKKTVKEAARDFMCTWDNGARDGVITYQEFEDYYKGNRQTDGRIYAL
jgi:hypothetical protein